MKQYRRWVGIAVFVPAVLLVGALILIYLRTESRLNKVYAPAEEGVIISADPKSIAHGRHIFQFRGCEACHSEGGFLVLPDTGQGEDRAHSHLPAQNVVRMEGNIYMDDPAIGQVVASNLTSGAGGVANQYTDAGWARAIRYGTRADGTPLLFMPSTEFYFLSDEDLSAVIAYIKSAPPVDHQLPPASLSLTGRIVMTLIPEITFISAELIPMDAPRPVAPEPGITAEYGEYLTLSCKVCHGLSMSGGAIPGFPSSWPEAPNLTFGGGSALPGWTEEDFLNAIRTGVTPEGKEIRGEYMPWTSYKYMYDDELKAVWAYLKFLPKKEYGNR